MRFLRDLGRRLRPTCSPTRTKTLITVCYKSSFWDIDSPHDTKSSIVIRKLKAHLARYGIPKRLVNSHEFKKFTTDWSVKHTTTSPHHSKANGKIESAVKAAKRMLRKTYRSGEDQYFALLNIRNVPTQDVDSSPAQRQLGRRTRTLLPTTQSLLEARNPVNAYVSEQLRLNQMRQAKYYNRSAHDLPVLKAGDTVRMKPFVLGQKSWNKAEVTRRLDERSYEVKSAGGTYRRNRQHLVLTPKSTTQQDTPKQTKVDAKVGSDQSDHLQPQFPAVQTRSEGNHVPSSARKHHAEGTGGTAAPKRTRSGRIIREPAKLRDYVRV